ncbi:MAG TPA: hypothetical protein VHM20_01140 [Gammaproteobacteria bacterium]|jgi:hypothetical protein|nr:hypothetical protein [Gammaproteobacteria bacterium]
MKCLITKLSTVLFLFLISNIVLAGWQVAKPDKATTATVSSDPFFQTNYKKENAQPRPIAAPAPVAVSAARVPVPIVTPLPQPRPVAVQKPAEVYAISVSGSLKENIERIMDRYHWKVVWKAPYDYNFDGRVTGASLPSVMEQLLNPFPLQAVLYMSNRTMAIVPRNV